MRTKFDESQITKIFTASSLGVKAIFDVINTMFTIIMSQKGTSWLGRMKNEVNKESDEHGRGKTTDYSSFFRLLNFIEFCIIFWFALYNACHYKHTLECLIPNWGSPIRYAIICLCSAVWYKELLSEWTTHPQVRVQRCADIFQIPCFLM